MISLSIFQIVFLIILLFAGSILLIKTLQKNKELNKVIESLVYNVQSTENIKSDIDYQDRSIVTHLKNIDIFTDIDDSRDYTILSK